MKNTSKKVLLYISDPLIILSIVILIIGITSIHENGKSIPFSQKHVTSARVLTTFKGGTTFHKFCEYTFSDGTTSKKYLFDVDISKANYENLDLEAYQECV